jgi:3-hydroxy acid dehydrogenase / malonic semialdehyde reductase
MPKTILITGATSGFGKAIAEKFASEKWNLIITGRRSEKLVAVADELRKQHDVRVYTLTFDVQIKQDVFAAIESLPIEWKNIDVLVNNAGLALGRDNFENADITDWETMMQTNVNGLLYVTKAVLPFMINQQAGHIINMGSVAAKDVYQFGNGYCGSKAAVDALSKSMRIDLLQHKIKVTAIHPGAAETEFSLVRFKGNEEKAKQIYEGYKALESKDIADTIFYCANLPKHVCINDLTITCTAQANAIYLNKV